MRVVVRQVYQTQTERRHIEADRRRNARFMADPKRWNDACTLTVEDPVKGCFVAINAWEPRKRYAPIPIKGGKCDNIDDTIRAFDLIKETGDRYIQKLPEGGTVMSWKVADWIPLHQAKEAVAHRRCIYGGNR